MKAKTQRLEMPQFGLEDKHGNPFWVEVPISLLEGFIFDVTDSRRSAVDDPGARRANARILDLVTAWNLTDEKDKPVPLTSSIKIESFTDDGEDVPEEERRTAEEKWHAARSKIVALCPIGTFKAIMERVTNQDGKEAAVDQAVAGF